MANSTGRQAWDLLLLSYNLCPSLLSIYPPQRPCATYLPAPYK